MKSWKTPRHLRVKLSDPDIAQQSCLHQLPFSWRDQVKSVWVSFRACAEGQSIFAWALIGGHQIYVEESAYLNPNTLFGVCCCSAILGMDTEGLLSGYAGVWE